MVEWVDLRAVTRPEGVLRVLGVALSCVSFSLVASVGWSSSPYWAWCMFSWCLCCLLTLLILLLELSRLSQRLPISWDDFTSAFATLAALMLLAASVIYPSVMFSCPACARQVAASVTSWLSVAPYVAEAVLACRRPVGQHSGFLSTAPGLLKILETFVACVIFTALDVGRHAAHAALRWCVAAYALCFIAALLIIILAVTRLSPRLPFDLLVCTCNLLALCAYLSAAVLWPLYAFRNHPRPSPCSANACLAWDSLVVVSFMTAINLLIYVLDSAYSIRLVVMSRRT
ncbi:hypothetical protein ACEWY4_026460 [Coilia grayii]|uniref:MARVEL domain-containing protein n=1 Tax=Coilia grayii TaxID=363190 RepID=A0ABD1IWZ4_9TELE